jgi:hypothetical protein
MGADIPEGRFYFYKLFVERRSGRRREICSKNLESLNYNEAELNHAVQDRIRTVDSRKSSAREPKKLINNSPLLSSLSGNSTVCSMSSLIGTR